MNRKIKNGLKRFYEEVGKKYPEEEKVYNTLRGILRQKFVLSHLEKFQGRLLDIGCNRGAYLRKYNGGHGVGVDLSFNVLAKIPDRLHFSLVVGDAERLFCFKPNSFDSILCSEVIEHCLNAKAVFEGIHWALRTGGKTLITTPNYHKKKPHWIDLGELKYFNVHSECNDKYFHTAYRPQDLQRLAESVGFEVVEVGTLEKEVKYATKIPVVILYIGRVINRLLRSARFDRLNQEFFERLSLAIYRLSATLRVNMFLTRLINEGVRSYILIQKSL